MIWQVWSLKCISSLFCVLLLLQVVRCSFYGNKDRNMDMHMNVINSPTISIPHMNRKTKGQKPHTKMKSALLYDSKIPKENAKETYLFHILTKPFRTPNLRLRYRSPKLVFPVSYENSYKKSSSSSHTNFLQYLSQISSLHKIRREEVVIESNHNIFPAKRKKRAVQSVQAASSDEKELGSEHTGTNFATASSQSVRVVRQNLKDTTKKSQEANNTGKSNVQGRILSVQWTAKGNYSAFWKLYLKYSQEKAIAKEAQIAFMCVVSLLCVMSWAVWCTGMCNRKKITYRNWNFQESHATVTMADILKRRGRYLPEESFYEEVIVHDRGSDP